ncbi:acyltransferase family protein [Olivibacter ginsenosidimutans]|uniref:Acyltransferase family protein n=1 Tax=Olivibacter ginsenosidimutans TaxID=1176537 RepID=A0ABP9BYT3_9SPHI
MKEYHNRYTALDVFRGLTICFMIIVNSPGAGAVPYAPLSHAVWHGFTPTDLVFPSFLFAVGNALSFSERKFNAMTTGKVFATIFKRALIIFLLGFLMYWFPFFKVSEQGGIIPFPFSETRVFGVLQRIALCYLCAALFVRFVHRRYLWWIGALLLLAYWAILVIFGTGDPFSLAGNAIAKLDLWLLGARHLYHDHGVIFDPEGLLSTLPAIVNVLAGYLTGHYLQKKASSAECLKRLVLFGVLAIVLALCWNPWFPINKKIWSSTFVLLTVGIDLLILPLLVLVSENAANQPRIWTRFFTILGKNPLFIYLLSEIGLVSLGTFPIGRRSCYEWINLDVIQPLLPGSAGSLLFALLFMFSCWLVGWFLDKKGIYIRV